MIVLEMLVLSLSGLEELEESLGEIRLIINYFLSKIPLSSLNHHLISPSITKKELLGHQVYFISMVFFEKDNRVLLFISIQFTSPNS